jgi:hypothetical protein
LLETSTVDVTSIDAIYDMLRSIHGFQLEELAGESMRANMAHPTGMLDVHGSWNSCQPNTVWQLISRNEWNEGPITPRDEVTEARRLGGYTGR